MILYLCGLLRFIFTNVILVMVILWHLWIPLNCLYVKSWWGLHGRFSSLNVWNIEIEHETRQSRDNGRGVSIKLIKNPAFLYFLSIFIFLFYFTGPRVVRIIFNRFLSHKLIKCRFFLWKIKSGSGRFSQVRGVSGNIFSLKSALPSNCNCLVVRNCSDDSCCCCCCWCCWGDNESIYIYDV